MRPDSFLASISPVLLEALGNPEPDALFRIYYSFLYNSLKLPAYLFVNQEGAHLEAQKGISLIALVGPNNFSNGLKSDIVRLNYFHRHRPGWINSVEGYYVSEQSDLFEEFISMHDIQFPLSKRNIPSSSYMDKVTTPLILIIDSQSGTILDTHQPILEVSKNNPLH